MKKKLEECRDIVAESIGDVEGQYPIGLVRVGRLLEEVLADWWDEDDVAMLAEEPAA